MSTMNPLKFLGGLVLEVGAVIAALAILPGLGGSGLGLGGSDSQPANGTQSASSQSIIPNQVYFDAQSSRVMDDPTQRPAPPAAWQNDFAPAPPVSQQRYVENMLDHNSQRALDAAARLWNQGDRLLPPDLRVRREVADDQAGEPLREVMPRTPGHRAESFSTENYNQSPTPPTQQEFRRPSHYAPPATQNSAPRYGSPEQPRRMDGRY